MHLHIVAFDAGTVAHLELLVARATEGRIDATSGWTTSVSLTGGEALSALADGCGPDIAADVLLVSPHLPDIDGVALVQRLRRCRIDTPILMVGDAQETETRAVAIERRLLEAGGDGWIRLPDPAEMTADRIGLFAARCLALHRRGCLRASPVIEIGPIRVDTVAAVLTVEDAVVRLTASEWAVVEILALSTPALVSRQELLRRIYAGSGAEARPAERIIAQFIYKVRRKLTPFGCEAYVDAQGAQGYALRSPV